jgi:hypothetical protein
LLRCCHQLFCCHQSLHPTIFVVNNNHTITFAILSVRSLVGILLVDILFTVVIVLFILFILFILVIIIGTKKQKRILLPSFVEIFKIMLEFYFIYSYVYLIFTKLQGILFLF